jgi:hypothetical protein
MYSSFSVSVGSRLVQFFSPFCCEREPQSDLDCSVVLEFLRVRIWTNFVMLFLD